MKAWLEKHLCRICEFGFAGILITAVLIAIFGKTLLCMLWLLVPLGLLGAVIMAIAVDWQLHLYKIKEWWKR